MSGEGIAMASFHCARCGRVTVGHPCTCAAAQQECGLSLSMCEWHMHNHQQPAAAESTTDVLDEYYARRVGMPLAEQDQYWRRYLAALAREQAARRQ